MNKRSKFCSVIYAKSKVCKISELHSTSMCNFILAQRCVFQQELCIAPFTSTVCVQSSRIFQGGGWCINLSVIFINRSNALLFNFPLLSVLRFLKGVLYFTVSG